MKKRLQHSCFPVRFAKILRTPNLKNICERLFLRKPQEELLNPTSRFLHFNLMSVYRLLRFSTLDSISQYGTLQKIMSNASSLYITQLTWKESNNFQQVSELIEQIHGFYPILQLSLSLLL